MTTHEEISQRAREIWEREGRPEGRAKEHWLQAETELQQKTLRTRAGSSTPSEDPALLPVTAGPKEENGRKRAPRRAR